MDAMIFAAGLGTRLRPLTDTMPKALIEVGGRTMLSRAIDHARRAGCERIVVNIHHHADMMRHYLATNYPEVLISDETPTMLETGGGLAAAATLFTPGANILVMNADILTDADTWKIKREHYNRRSDVTLMTMARATSRYLLFDPDGRMRGWTNISTREVRPAGLDTEQLLPLAFCGIHVVGPKALERLQAYAQSRSKFSITDFYIDQCADLLIRAYSPSQPITWIDIGRPESLAAAQALAK